MLPRLMEAGQRLSFSAPESRPLYEAQQATRCWRLSFRKHYDNFSVSLTNLRALIGLAV